MTTETTGNSKARKVKAISALILVAGLLIWIVGFAAEAPAIVVGLGSLAFFGGFFGFVVGRFME